MIYKYLLFDLDDTLFDYEEAETTALNKVLRKYAIQPTGKFIETYHKINRKLWSDYEKGIVQKEEILATRFSKTVQKLNLAKDGSAMSKDYQLYLGQGYQLLSGAKNCLDLLKARGYKMYALTNGVERTQLTRLEGSGLNPYFEKVYISEQTGTQKPFKAFYDYVFSNSPEIDRQASIMIGDSLSSDIKGAENTGIDSCWINFKEQSNHTTTKATFTVENYTQLLQYLP